MPDLIDRNELKNRLKWGWANDKFVLRTIDEMPAVNTWISVKDRLPKDDEDVLAYLDCGEESRITACNYSHGVWYDCVMNDIVIVARNITHWMPLPEPPKEG